MAEEKAAPKKGLFGNKKLIIIAVVVILLIGGGAAAYFLFLKKPHVETNKKSDVEMILPSNDNKGDIGPMIDISEFIVNIISEDSSHYVKAALTLELSTEQAVEEAEKRLPQIRDAILLLISNKTIEELQDLHGKKQLKAEVKSNINAFMQSGQVKNIYLTDFVVQ